MELEEKIKILKRFDLFDKLTNRQLSVIAKSIKEKTFPAKTIFIEQETQPDVAFFIYQGGAKVYRITPEGEEFNLSIVGPGEVVGEMALIDHDLRSANVETIQETKALFLSRASFQMVLENNPEIAFNLLLILSKRVRKLSEFVQELLSQKLPERTWHILELLSKYFPNGEITLSQEELAQIIGATRARVTEILNKLDRDNKISLSHKKIIIIS